MAIVQLGGVCGFVQQWRQLRAPSFGAGVVTASGMREQHSGCRIRWAAAPPVHGQRGLVDNTRAVGNGGNSNPAATARNYWCGAARTTGLVPSHRALAI